MNNQIRSLFPVTNKYVYLNHSAVCPLSVPVSEAMTCLIEDITENGAVHYQEWLDRTEEARNSAARLVNARTHEIAFMRNTSSAISTIANGIDWTEGDNVVTCNMEFPANIYPWMRLQAQRGVQIRMAREREGRIETDELLGLADERTRVITISWVQFSSGYRIDLARIGRFCRERGIMFVVDAIQGLGGLRLDVEACSVDAFAADAHKYLLGPEGIALLYVSDRVLERIQPTDVGWMSVTDSANYLDYHLSFREGALRFECGTLNTVGVYGLGAAIRLFLETGPSAIEDYLLDLGRYLADGLENRGYRVIGPRNPAERSAIVTCTHDKYKPADLYGRLKSQRIVTAPRVGRLRISPHFYNTKEEIDLLLGALPQ
jgi:selenocysteine lyase/cysteine desulfurase